MTQALLSWLATAAPGDSTTYHTGDLTSDRALDPDLNRTAEWGPDADWLVA